VLVTGEGHLHGFSHTYAGATLLAVFSALTGKYLAAVGCYVLGPNRQWLVKISWRVTFLSAFIGAYSHVLLDSLMHADLEPFYPFTTSNRFLGLISVAALHKLCQYSGAIGGLLYFAIPWLQNPGSRFNKRDRIAPPISWISCDNPLTYPAWPGKESACPAAG